MMTLLALCVVVFAAGAQASAPSRDFSGEWTISLEKSRLELKAFSALTEATVRIDHCDPDFTLHRRFVVSGTESTLTVTFTTDGKETVTREGDQIHRSTAAWDNEVLVFVTRIEAPQGVATNTVRYRLLEGGRVLEADEVFKGPRLGYHNVWVFERKPIARHTEVEDGSHQRASGPTNCMMMSAPAWAQIAAAIPRDRKR